MVETMPRQKERNPHEPEAAGEVFDQRRIRVTQPRLALAQLLFGNGPRHVSAESLYSELVRSGAPGSLGSVYRSLKDLSGAGLVKRVPIYGSTAWFDTQIDPHHHFYAEDEDRVFDVPDAGIRIDDLPSPPEGYEFVGVDLLLRIRRRDRPHNS